MFQPRFAELPTSSKVGQIGGLVLLLASFGALIVPSTQHMMIERLQATRRIQGVITRCLDFALLPLALALALDITIQTRSAAGNLVGALCGGAVLLAAWGLWFAWTLTARGRKGSRERTMAAQRESENTPLSKQIEQMLTEARTILPGAQALLGFQLTVFLTQGFIEMVPTLQIAHVGALLLVAMTVLLLMLPAAYHRIVYAGEDSKDLLRVGTRTITLATLPLGAALALDASVVCAHALHAPMAAALLGGLIFSALLGAWFAYPLLARARRGRAT